MKTHQFGVRQHIYPFIEDGSKSLEVRVEDEKRKKVKKGDFITFNQKLSRRIVKIRRYSSFIEMLRNEDLEKIIPRVTAPKILEELKKTYTEEQEKLGVLVFELQVDE